MAKSRTVTSPVNMGLYLDRPHVHIPDGGMYDCQNVGIRNGKVRNDGQGWSEWADLSMSHFTSTFDTEMEILHLGLFKTSDGTEYVMAVTELDVLRWDGTDWQYVNDTDHISSGGGAGGDVDPAGGTILKDGGIDALAEIGDWIYIEDSEGAVTHPFTQFEGSHADDWYRITDNTTSGQVTVDRNITGDATPPNRGYTIRHNMGFTLGEIFDSTTYLIDGSQDDHWVVVNGVDGAMWSWNPDDTEMIDRSKPCAAVAVVNNILLAAGAPNEPTTINYGVPGTPFSFGSSIVMSDTAGALVRLMPLYDGVVAYCEDSIHILTYVGGDVEFTIRTAISDRGLYAPRCLLDRGNWHEFISRDGLYRFDGVTMQRTSAQVFDPVVQDLEFVRMFRALVFFDENYSESYWAIPAPDDPDGPGEGTQAAKYAYVIHEAEPAGKGHLPVTKKNLVDTSCGLSIPQQQLTLFGTVDGKIMSIDGSDDFDGVDVSSWATFARRPVIDGNFKGVISRVEPFTEDGDFNLNVRLFIGDFVEEDASDMTTEFIILNTTHSTNPRFVSFREAARYYSLRFWASASNDLFSLSGFAVTISPAGER